MAKYLSQEWLDEGRKLAESQPERPGASARMQYVVTGGPEGDIKYYWILEEGKLVDSRLGEIDDADFTLTLSYADSVAIQKGELDPTTAFMQGRIRVTGNMDELMLLMPLTNLAYEADALGYIDMVKLMLLMPLTNSPEYKALQEQIRAITEY